MKPDFLRRNGSAFLSHYSRSEQNQMGGSHLKVDDDERNVNDIIQNLAKKLEEHEQRIRFLETNDKIQQQEIIELKSAIHRKDSYMLGAVAFYAYMSHNEITSSPHHILVFDHVVTNSGGSYNPHLGAFTAPEHGVYVFSWTVVCDHGSYANTEILRNSDSIGQILTNSVNNIDYQIATGLIATELNANDVVHIQTHVTEGAKGTILSADYMRTSFTGWKL
ncbi:complement C1q subcomponent subunit B-like [Saccostrea echinata]|uniref:complement C1q subcomponent subunit B-like n=1 Tax=Saccostrea echinata TaxID=191078 RepID=UPI002A8401AE|nr:complement C1q subcomponent subunit B-like [Saccostrea echinata]